ncbi:MAG: tRNA pseudouridine(55) synthase TruB [Armatimonadetes bacterium]|nr:tRNA pseudouridine(55) synthase TruB [Armatimonadota bacterium]
MRNDKSLHGILNLLKPPGMTSHDAVDFVRRKTSVRRVGHTGTLDPAASGVLVLCVGHATRLADYVSGLTKTYRAEVTFGVTTDTYDADGTVLDRRESLDLAQADLLALLPSFTGEILQRPPPHSAVHVGGKKLYEWNRDKVEVTVAPRAVRVLGLRCLHFGRGTFPRAVLEIKCSKGTYVRSLAHDLGQTMGCGAYLSFLVREAVGSFALQASLTLEKVASSENVEELLLPLSAAVEHFPSMVVKERGLSRLQNGIPLSPEDFVSSSSATHGEEIALLGFDGQLIAIGQYHQVGRQYFQVKAEKVFLRTGEN